MRQGLRLRQLLSLNVDRHASVCACVLASIGLRLHHQLPSSPHFHVNSVASSLIASDEPAIQSVFQFSNRTPHEHCCFC